MKHFAWSLTFYLHNTCITDICPCEIWMKFHIISNNLSLFSDWWLTGFPQKSRKKVPWFFHDFTRLKSKFPDKKIPIFVLQPIYQIVDRQTHTHSHTQTHTWFDQGQPAIQQIFLVTFEKWYWFLISIQTLYLILSLSYLNVRENILMQLTQPANNSKNVSDHCCDQFFLCVLITQVQND